MRNRYVTACLAVLVLLGAADRFWPGMYERVASVIYASGPPDEEDGVGDFAGWQPTTREIAGQIDAMGPGASREARERRFAWLFQHRFREHGFAVGVRFLSARRIKLMCGALMPRWDMTRVALALHGEARTVLGADTDIDLYETFIALRQRKVAELRHQPGSSRLAVVFDERFSADGPGAAARASLLAAPKPAGRAAPAGAAVAAGPLP